MLVDILSYTLKSVLLYWVMIWFDTLFHELGHAISFVMLTNQSCSCSVSYPHPLPCWNKIYHVPITIGRITLCFNDRQKTIIPRYSTSKYRLLIVYLSGPIAGALISVVIRIVSGNISLDIFIIATLISNLYPIHEVNNDGMMIVKLFHPNSQGGNHEYIALAMAPLWYIIYGM